MIKYILMIAVVISLGGCSRDIQSFQRDTMKQNGTHIVCVYSGGIDVFNDTFVGVINQEESSDGIFYIKNDTLIEISGDYIIKQRP